MQSCGTFFKFFFLADEREKFLGLRLSFEDERGRCQSSDLEHKMSAFKFLLCLMQSNELNLGLLHHK